MLRDLDLSSNALEGPLGPSTVPTLSSLTTLHLADNTFASIRRGALAGKQTYTVLLIVFLILVLFDTMCICCIAHLLFANNILGHFLSITFSVYQ